MSVRRAATLIEHLPEGSAYKRSLGSGELRDWDMHAQLLGLVVEQVDALRQTTVALNSKRRTTVKPLSLVPRPKRAARRRSTSQALADLDSALGKGQ